MGNADDIFNAIKNDAIQQLTAKTNSTANSSPGTTNLFIDERIYTPGSIIYAGDREIPIIKETVMVFADDQPFYNWSHPCRYILYDANGNETGNMILQEIPACFPPYLIETPTSFKSFYQQVFPPLNPIVDYSALMPSPGLVPPYSVYQGGERYAVLFSGATLITHLNDLEYVYRILIDFYGFSPDNIYVLNYDGTYVKNSAGTLTPNYNDDPAIGISCTWPVDKTPYRLKVNKDGTKDSLISVFKELKGKLKCGDLLFIHTNNHGLGPGKNSPCVTECSLCTYGTPGTLAPSISANKFGKKLKKYIPEIDNLIVMMAQCHSGGFKEDVLTKSKAKKTTFIAACEADRESQHGSDFDYFAMGWFWQITGSPQGSITNLFGGQGGSQGKPDLSMYTAFSMLSGDAWLYKNPPVFASKPEGCGNTMTLGQFRKGL